ncbi:DUF4946 domain-containing protein [Pseudomonas citronellolis]|uniref:DUF4946 domain-containing protein n=1 Tax=Pseudomonas citronellolis TaxID=53408 RepID=UPI0023E47241|nr:DUF4946 domain-containing protein [Pseudomonas citronellolis]MDF3931070.1 DUF4946 domain-containing protein [Pseudomonas citronellolis]
MRKGGWGGLLLVALCAAAGGVSAAGLVEWPEGWQVTRSPAAEGAEALSRERGVRLADDGSQAVVMEITRSRLARVEGVDLQRVIAQMRKNLQIDFMQQGLLAACSKPQDASLGGLAGLELVCSISRNGTEVMKQKMQVALGKEAAYSLTFAAPSAHYAEQVAAVEAVRSGLHLE